MKKMTGVVAVALVVSILFSGNTDVTAKTVKNTEIKTKKVTMKVGQKKQITLKNKQKKAKYLFKSSKTKIVKVSKKGVMTALKTGKAKITVREQLGKKTKKIGTVTVTVKNAAEKEKMPDVVQTKQPDPVVTQTPTATPSITPNGANQTATPQVPSNTEQPQSTPVLTTEPSPEPTPTLKPPIDPEIKDTPKNFDKAQSGVSYGTIKKVKYYSTTTEKDRNAIVILPNGYSEEEQYPVLYLFHGGMGDENDWIDGGIRNMIGNMNASLEAKDMIIVLPNCRCREDDSKANADGVALGHVQSFDNFLNDFRDNLMPYIESNFSVLTGRDNTAIAGLSMGGRVALNIGINLYEKVGYIGAFSPAYGIFPYTNMGLTEEGLFTEETFTIPEPYNNSTFLLINTGNQDNMVSGEPARYHNALEANGVHHTFYTLDGSHDWVVWRNGFYNFARYIFQ